MDIVHLGFQHEYENPSALGKSHEWDMGKEYPTDVIAILLSQLSLIVVTNENETAGNVGEISYKARSTGLGSRQDSTDAHAVEEQSRIKLRQLGVKGVSATVASAASRSGVT